jgi:hypothetical protein
MYVMTDGAMLFLHFNNFPLVSGLRLPLPIVLYHYSFLNSFTNMVFHSRPIVFMTAGFTMPVT